MSPVCLVLAPCVFPGLCHVISLPVPCCPSHVLRFGLSCDSVSPPLSLVITLIPAHLSLVMSLSLIVVLSNVSLPLVVPCSLPTCVLFSPVYLSPSLCSAQWSVIVFVTLFPVPIVAWYCMSF